MNKQTGSSSSGVGSLRVGGWGEGTQQVVSDGGEGDEGDDLRVWVWGHFKEGICGPLFWSAVPGGGSW